MKKLLGILGVAFLAQIIFVGMIHFLLAVQGNDSPDTVRSLSAMPVIGGFFFPPEVVEAPLDPVIEAERRERILLDEARQFYPSVTTESAEKLQQLQDELISDRERYRQRIDELQERETAVQRAEEEVQTERERLEADLATIQERAADLEAQRNELDRRLIRVSDDETENLKRLVGAIANMTPQVAAELIEGTGEGELEQGLDIAWAAKIMSQLEERKAGQIMNALGQATRLKLFNAMTSLTNNGGEGQ